MKYHGRMDVGNRAISVSVFPCCLHGCRNLLERTRLSAQRRIRRPSENADELKRQRQPCLMYAVVIADTIFIHLHGCRNPPWSTRTKTFVRSLLHNINRFTRMDVGNRASHDQNVSIAHLHCCRDSLPLACIVSFNLNR